MSAEQGRQRSPMDTDSDMQSSTLTFSSTRPPLSTPGTTPASSHHPTPRNSRPLRYHSQGAALADAEASMTGRGRKCWHQLRRAEAQHVAYHVHSPISLSNVFTTERYVNSIQCPATHVMKRTSSGGFLIYQWWSRNDDLYRGRGYLWMMARRAIMVHRRTMNPSRDRGCARVW